MFHLALVHRMDRPGQKVTMNCLKGVFLRKAGREGCNKSFVLITGGEGQWCGTVL